SDETGVNRVSRCCEYNRDDRCRSLCRYCRRRSRRHNDIHVPPHELGRDLRETLVASFPPAILDGDGSILGPAEFAESLHKGGDALAIDRTRVGAQNPDGRQPPRLLRPRRERPRGRRTAEQGDELAAAAHSITSSALTISELGTIRPRAFAVFKLIASSNLVGSCTGRSAGLSPLRMRSVYAADCRNTSGRSTP